MSAEFEFLRSLLLHKDLRRKYFNILQFTKAAQVIQKDSR